MVFHSAFRIPHSTISITTGRVLYIAFVGVCLVLVVRQYGGWNFEASLAAWRAQMNTLSPGVDEQQILERFRRVQPLNKSFSIGIVGVADHHPVFGGEDYRVYDIGYYDLDKYMRHLAHITCIQGQIKKIDPVVAREPHAPVWIKDQDEG